MKKKMAAALLCAGLTAFLPLAQNSVTPPRWGWAQTVSAADNVSYLDADGAMQTVSGAAEITPADTAWTEGWYVVSGEVTIETRVAVTGDVHLILADGCHLTVNGGIGLSNADTDITIYGQQAGTGALIATAGGEFDAGIGSNQYGACGNITVNGGTVSAASKKWGAGIGSSFNGDCGFITINGGIVTAICEDFYGSGIGNGDYGSCGLILISGGTVSASGGVFGDGIGNADSSKGASFSTGTDGNAVIYAASGASSGQAIVGMEDKTGWCGIFFLNNDENGLFCGETVQPTADFEIPEGKNLAIGENQTLVIPAGVTMTVIGKIQNNGRIICYGAITGEENISGNAVIYPQPEPEPEPTPDEPEGPEEAEEETFIPSEPISDGLHKYSMGTMLYQGGKRVKGLTEYENATYYFDQSGWMQTGWVEFDGGWRYFAEDGRMVTGWLQIGNAWYYLDPDTGIMYNDGLAIIGKSTYYFHDWGGMASDWWYEAEDGWYYFGGSGTMKAACWLQWNGGWYYLGETGKMAVNADIGGYYVNADGVWVP